MFCNGAPCVDAAYRGMPAVWTILGGDKHLEDLYKNAGSALKTAGNTGRPGLFVVMVPAYPVACVYIRVPWFKTGWIGIYSGHYC